MALLIREHKGERSQAQWLQSRAIKRDSCWKRCCECLRPAWHRNFGLTT